MLPSCALSWKRRRSLFSMQNAGNLLTSWTTVRFSLRTLLHVVTKIINCGKFGVEYHIAFHLVWRSEERNSVILAWFRGTGTRQWCNYSKWKESRTADGLALAKQTQAPPCFPFKMDSLRSTVFLLKTILQEMWQHRVVTSLSNKTTYIHTNMKTRWGHDDARKVCSDVLC